MLRKLWCIVLIIVFNCSNIIAQSLSEDQVKNIEVSIRAFMSALKEYSNCKGEDYRKKQAQIFDQHDEADATDKMFNDLFSAENNGTDLENNNWAEYLSNIKNQFNNEIAVEYKNISVLNCLVINEGNTYVYVSIDKSLTYKTQKSSYTILVAVNLSNNNSIKEVVSPKFFKNSENGTCEIGIDKTDIAGQVLFLRTAADDYFEKKDFINAKESYSALANKFPNDLTVKSRINECEKLISYQAFFDKAQELFETKKYSEAKKLYSEILKSYPEADPNRVKKQLSLIDVRIAEENYKRQIELADYYFQVANYEEARKYYGIAINYKPKDNYALSQIEKAKVGDKRFVLSEINKAIQLAEESKRNYGEAFKIMSQYELSGLLSTQNYYFLTAMMFSKNREVKRVMNYTAENFDNYLNIYVKKLKEKNQLEPTSDATFLLDEVVNKRYQK